MTHTRRLTATYDAAAVRVTFSAIDDGDIVGIEVEAVTILGVDVDYDKLPDDLQTAISVLSDEVEFEDE